MFSFFKTKKPSPTHTPVEPIPGAAPAPPREDDFIFIERRGASPKPNVGGEDEKSPLSPGGSGLYPAIPGPLAKDPAKVAPVARQYSEEKWTHFMSQVPFKLAPELCVDDLNELSRLQTYDVLSYITQILYSQEYNFHLEKSVLNEMAKEDFASSVDNS
ncbi:hypothetical protein ZHAS_00011725 [Anopheles sinensis]|uniref:UMA domain-containing protein n=1 Tax=Anopheles sinensis TaxID=74873 RepID=A0A084W108_ANOSI|nr:hypothetical protein ZHAS_00011725 [Anopheles sinensis]